MHKVFMSFMILKSREFLLSTNWNWNNLFNLLNGGKKENFGIFLQCGEMEMFVFNCP